jgi:hypothetical protein
MYVTIAEKRLQYVVADNVQDDFSTLEFHDGEPGRPGTDLVAGLTWYDRPSSPLLVHLPTEVDYAFLQALVRFAVDWIATNDPHVRLQLDAPRT